MNYFDDTRAERRKTQIERINELSNLARTAWFALLGYLVFVGVTLLGVQDADFFLPARQTRLPLVGVDIPTASFFWTAPVLGAALYIYLHLFLIKLWDAHADARTTDADPTHHWLVNDFVLIRQRDPVAIARPLARLTDWITRLLVWVAGPLVLAYAWWRSMPAHNEWMTLLIALCLLVALVVGFTSWWRADQRLGRPRRSPRGAWWQREAAIVVTILLLSASWLRTEGGFEYHASGLIDLYGSLRGRAVFRPDGSANGDARAAPIEQEEWINSQCWIPKTHWFTFDGNDWPFGNWLDAGRGETWNPLATTDLAGGALGWPPEGWRDRDYAQRRYRQDWCERREFDLLTCESFSGDDTSEARRQIWCSDQRIAAGDCDDRFEAVASDFRAEWEQERDAYLSQQLDDPDQVGRDLRRADLGNSFLADADLHLARLQGAYLGDARLEGANLRWARLEGAILLAARLEKADLREARLDGAVLWSARLEEADLRAARLDGALLWRARLERADLRGARLERVSFWGADLRAADFRSSDWTGASNRASPAQFADFRGAQ